MKTSVLLLALLIHFTFSGCSPRNQDLPLCTPGSALLTNCNMKHSLKFIYIASSGAPDFSEFAGAIVVDEILVAYCDSKVHIKEDWVKNVFDNNPEQLERYANECLEIQPLYFRTTIDNLKQRFNQSGGEHILQRVSGCEWDDETGEVNGFNQYGYNGEDFISFDMKTSSWIAPSPQAFSTKLNWEADKGREIHNKFHLTQVFPNVLKRYIHYGKSTLLRTDLPSVSLLQKSPSSPVTCHATGFYPDRAVIFWRRDGEELFEDVEHGEILPNHDGSFQMSVDLLRLPSEDRRRYECVFQLDGVKEDIVTKLHKDVIRTNYSDSSVITITITIIILAAVCCLLLAGAAYKYHRAPGSESSPETSSELSERLRADG